MFDLIHLFAVTVLLMLALTSLLVLRRSVEQRGTPPPRWVRRTAAYAAWAALSTDLWLTLAAGSLTAYALHTLLVAVLLLAIWINPVAARVAGHRHAGRAHPASQSAGPSWHPEA